MLTKLILPGEKIELQSMEKSILGSRISFVCSIGIKTSN